MTLYLLRRLLSLIPILLGVTLFTFALTRITPGDPVGLMLGPRATPEQVAALRAELGLDASLPVQYGRYVLNALRGDLGRSIRGQTPVLAEISLRLPSTLALALTGLALAIGSGLSVGLLAALLEGTLLGRLLMGSTLAAMSVPIFWLAPVLILIFGLRLGWLPISGGASGPTLILPSLCLAIAPAALLARLSRAAILEAMQADYVRTARAKGLQECLVYLRHALPNASIPLVTVIGLLAASLLTGTVFIEVIFARPGLGRFAVNAVFNRDFPQIQGIVLFTTGVFVLINLLVDLLYALLDPRIRYG
jgi:ABC-type dipeptide/oligopeptide/nickel transport system permease component